MGLTVALCLAVPGFAAAQEGQQTQDELQRNQEEIRDARVTLEELEKRVARAESQLGDIEQTLARHRGDLAALSGQLDEARAAEAEAAARTLEVSLELESATATMTTVAADLEDSQSELRRRVVTAYKRGAPGDIALAATLRAGDVHDLLITTRTVQRMVRDGRRVVDETQELLLAHNDARRIVADRRATSAAVTRTFQRARRGVEDLVQRQQATVKAVERQHAERAAILAEFDADRLGQVAIVQRLKARTVELSARLAAEIAEKWKDVQFDGPMPDWAPRLPTAGRKWAPAISGAAARNGLDPRLFASLVWAESYFNPAVVSSAGAIGLAQLMPGTAAGMGVDPWDPIENLNGGARYLSAQLQRFGSIDLALAAYNAGPGAVSKYGGVPPYAETQFYVLRVLGYYERLLGI